MRVRKKPHTQDALKELKDIVCQSNEARERLLGKENIHLEIGTGKGSFIAQLAQNSPDDFFVGIEFQTEIIYLAALKIKQLELKNILLIHANANDLTDWFVESKVQTIFINFCDPWPKARHAKRRLVYCDFLNKYLTISSPSAHLQFKTDNTALFEFALEEIFSLNLNIIEKSIDLHNSSINNPIWTEYETKFHTLGMAINFCKVSLSKNEATK